MNAATRTLLADLAAGLIPRSVPDDCEYREEMIRLVAYLRDLEHAALALSVGDLTAMPSPARGPVVGALKAAQASLRHLTWQAQQIASGDFSQRVDFMGDFSRAFNNMVEQLARSRADLVFESTHDGLTGLYNRAFFEAEVERLARGRVRPISVVVIDLDGLKEVNDNLGHAAGDALITKAARVLQAAFRAEDVVARIGGDEFAALFPAVDEPVGATILGRLAERTRAANEEEDEPPLAMSVGLATASAGSELRQAIKLADERMYADKTARKAGR